MPATSALPGNRARARTRAHRQAHGDDQQRRQRRDPQRKPEGTKVVHLRLDERADPPRAVFRIEPVRNPNSLQDALSLLAQDEPSELLGVRGSRRRRHDAERLDDRVVELGVDLDRPDLGDVGDRPANQGRLGVSLSERRAGPAAPTRP